MYYPHCDVADGSRLLAAFCTLICYLNESHAWIVLMCLCVSDRKEKTKCVMRVNSIINLQSK
jgi:hypothetical protein